MDMATCLFELNSGAFYFMYVICSLSNIFFLDLIVNNLSIFLFVSEINTRASVSLNFYRSVNPQAL